MTYTAADVDASQYKFAQVQLQQFHDPAIMAARFSSHIIPPVVHDGIYANPPMVENTNFAYGPPPGLSLPPNIASVQSHVDPQSNESTYGEYYS